MSDIGPRIRKLRGTLPAGNLAVPVAAFNTALGIIADLAEENEGYRDRLTDHAVDVRRLAERTLLVEQAVNSINDRLAQ